MKKLIVLLLGAVMALLCCDIGGSEPDKFIAFQGIVYDKQTGNPIPEAEVFYDARQIDSLSPSVLTGEDGHYGFSMFQHQYVFMRAVKAGYIPIDTQITVVSWGIIMDVDLALEREN
ncbi:MAG TPA: hypothetical protein ENO22_02245 [candidate division Zixibacteria bacterium]|nr:hypothetical protein [candidate division Zixibacteria bacterium]